MLVEVEAADIVVEGGKGDEPVVKVLRARALGDGNRRVAGDVLVLRVAADFGHNRIAGTVGNHQFLSVGASEETHFVHAAAALTIAAVLTVVVRVIDDVQLAVIADERVVTGAGSVVPFGLRRNDKTAVLAVDFGEGT